MTEREKRVDLNSELGVSRRDLIRRGAIVGGTLLWAAPVIQSINAGVARAAGASNACATCYCRWRRNNNSFIADKCYTVNGNVPANLVDDASCAAYCVSPTNPDVPTIPQYAPAKTQHAWCSGTHCACQSGMPGPPLATRVVCS